MENPVAGPENGRARSEKPRKGLWRRARIDQTRAGLLGLFQERHQADIQLRDQIATLVDAVKADPAFGANSALYGAFG